MRFRDQCLSACVIILAGSYYRSRAVAGTVGIHRPYFVEDENLELSYSDLQAAYDALYDELSSLFDRWNLPKSLIDAMYAVPSDEVRILTPD